MRRPEFVIPCRKCGAPAGQLCILPTRIRRRVPSHAVRRNDWATQQREAQL